MNFEPLQLRFFECFHEIIQYIVFDSSYNILFFVNILIDTLDGYSTWSSDSAKIAFRSDRDDNTEVYIVNTDGSGQTIITNNRVFDGNPPRSPDGTYPLAR